MTRQDPPAPEEETPHPMDAEILGDLQKALCQRHAGSSQDAESIRLEGGQGPGAAWLKASVPRGRQVHEVEIFTRDVPGEALEAIGLVADYLDGVLTELTEADGEAFLPLDFVGAPFEGFTIFARSRLRDLEAERLADELLRNAP